MLGELNGKEIIDFLKDHSIGRLGCTDGEMVYIVPINYHYEENSIICYSLEGRKIEVMRNHPAVCFEVDEIMDLYNWKCVVINGVYEEVIDKAELDLLRPRYTEYFLRKRATLPSPTLSKSEDEDNKIIVSEQVFYRIRFDNVSGRFQKGFN